VELLFATNQFVSGELRIYRNNQNIDLIRFGQGSQVMMTHSPSSLLTPKGPRSVHPHAVLLPTPEARDAYAYDDVNGYWWSARRNHILYEHDPELNITTTEQHTHHFRSLAFAEGSDSSIEVETPTTNGDNDGRHFSTLGNVNGMFWFTVRGGSAAQSPFANTAPLGIPTASITVGASGQSVLYTPGPGMPGYFALPGYSIVYDFTQAVTLPCNLFNGGCAIIGGFASCANPAAGCATAAACSRTCACPKNSQGSVDYSSCTNAGFSCINPVTSPPNGVTFGSVNNCYPYSQAYCPSAVGGQVCQKNYCQANPGICGTMKCKPVGTGHQCVNCATTSDSICTANSAQ